jgi:hypothetical protein
MWTRIKLVINIALISVTCARMVTAWIGKKSPQLAHEWLNRVAL